MRIRFLWLLARVDKIEGWLPVLTGYDIQTIREDEYKKMVEEESGLDLPLTEVEELSDHLINKLIKGGFETIRDVVDAELKEIVALPGIGEKTAEKIKEVLESQK